jgi:sec-independent protein translocase protein TatA
MGGLSWWHWLVIGAVFILLFGAKRLPEAARGVGRSLRILKSEVAAMNLDEPQAADAAVDTDLRVFPIEPAPLGQAPTR